MLPFKIQQIDQISSCKKNPSIFYRMTNGLKLLRFKNPWRNANSTIQNNRNNLHTECIYRPQKVQQMI